MQVIQLTVGSPEFNEIIRAVRSETAKETLALKPEWDWVDAKEAMRLLDIGKDMLAIYRRERKITISQPSERVIHYSKKSINEHLNKYKINAR